MTPTLAAKVAAILAAYVVLNVLLPRPPALPPARGDAGCSCPYCR